MKTVNSIDIFLPELRDKLFKTPKVKVENLDQVYLNNLNAYISLLEDIGMEKQEIEELIEPLIPLLIKCKLFVNLILENSKTRTLILEQISEGCLFFKN